MGLGANSILQGWLLLEQRKRQAQQDRQAEEQQEIENIQAQAVQARADKEQKRLDKEQKRMQKVTDLNSQVLERKFALDTAVKRLQFEEGQAIGKTSSRSTFQLPEVSEDFTGPRTGGIIGRQDTSGLAGPYGAPSFQPEARQDELIQAFGINQQLQAMQQQQKALNSPQVAAAQIRAAQDELERISTEASDKTKEEGEERRFMATLASNSLLKLAIQANKGEVRALVRENRNNEASALIPGFSDGTHKFSSMNKVHQKALSMMAAQGKFIFNFDTRKTMEKIVRTTSLLDRLEAFVRDTPSLFPVGAPISEFARQAFIESISSKFGEASVKKAEFAAFNRQLSSDAQDLTGEPASKISDNDIKLLREGMGQPGDSLRVVLFKINSARQDLANNILGQTVNERTKDFNAYASVVGQIYAQSPSMLPYLLKKGTVPFFERQTPARTLESVNIPYPTGPRIRDTQRALEAAPTEPRLGDKKRSLVGHVKGISTGVLTNLIFAINPDTGKPGWQKY